jgi:hypothetical protein
MTPLTSAQDLAMLKSPPRFSPYEKFLYVS